MRSGFMLGAWTQLNLLVKVLWWCKQGHFSWLLCQYNIPASSIFPPFVFDWVLLLSQHPLRLPGKKHMIVIAYDMNIVHFRMMFHRYEGSIGAASCAVAAADQLASQLYRKNLWCWFAGVRWKLPCLSLYRSSLWVRFMTSAWILSADGSYVW